MGQEGTLTQVTVRLDPDDIARADALISYVERLPYVEMVGSVTRGTILRAAIEKGLAVMEAERDAAAEVETERELDMLEERFAAETTASQEALKAALDEAERERAEPTPKGS